MCEAAESGGEPRKAGTFDDRVEFWGHFRGSRPFALSVVVLEVVPWVVGLVAFIGALAFPRFMDDHVMAPDRHPNGPGWFEEFTVVILCGAVAFGIFLLVRYWKVFPSPLLRTGVVLWIAGCVYFAGEEISWGQWYFKWETPEWVGEVNRQKETNLNNTSGWFDKKPRAILEVWMLFAGLALPFLRRLGYLRYPLSDLREWINPACLGVSASLVFLVSKIVDSFDGHQRLYFGSAETREVLIAVFLAAYLVSISLPLLILSRRKDAAESPDTAVSR